MTSRTRLACAFVELAGKSKQDTACDLSPTHIGNRPSRKIED
jgi:hypothetical protein